jgi:hypothetical protein
MAREPHLPGPGHPRERRAAAPAAAAAAAPAEDSKTTAGPLPGTGPLGADITSFRLHLTAEGKAARTVQGYTAAVAWFADASLLGQAGKTSWEQATATMSGNGRSSCWTATAPPTPASSSGHCASSSSGWPPKNRYPTRWTGSAPPRWQSGKSRYSPA